ncbi:PspC domain-containing protein [uncultured Tyzzerella sp.]|uniref:PspC domain-containing protein n=1 Tax=uncultured Tyzzerella sp. TaxID=2321398 RepID=UPI002942D1CD|nr:PspC domain-containing protein [uncultured Tyzzerella sp.]
MKKFTRSLYDRKIAGICGGIGKYYNIDSNLVRILFLILFAYFGVLLFMYIICVFIVPNEIV